MDKRIILQAVMCLEKYAEVANNSTKYKKRVDQAKALSIPVATGLGVGFGKGYIEERLMPFLKKRYKLSPATSRGIGRGAVAGGSSLIYALSTLATMKALSNAEKKYKKI